VLGWVTFFRLTNQRSLNDSGKIECSASGGFPARCRTLDFSKYVLEEL